MHKINDLLDLYERRFREAVAAGKRSPTTLDNYIRPGRGLAVKYYRAASLQR